MAILIELECRGIGHEKINLGFIQKILNFSERVIFIADKSHTEIISNQLPADLKKRVNFISVKIPDKHYKLSSVIKYYKIFQSLKGKIDYNDNIFMLSFFSWNLLALKFFLIYEKIKIKSLFLVCHGFLEFLIELRSFKGIKRYLKPKNIHVFFSRCAMKFFNRESFTYVFLSKHIETNFKNSRILKNSILYKTIDLPYFFDPFKAETSFKDLCFGTIGKGNLVMTKKLLEEREFLKFKIISSISSNDFIRFNNCTFFNQSSRLTRNKIAQEVKEVNYLLFFYPERSYQLSVSGALYDAINYLKPIIFFKNSCLSYYNNIYNIGIECENLEEMISIIDSKVQLEDEYPIFLENLENLKLKLEKDDINLLWH